MAISEVDIKLLWARAGRICSKPDCTEDLTVLIESGNYVVGEMAHIIGRKPSAKRGRPQGGGDTYDNLILLCPTHHTHIDKAPEGTYPEALLREWKRLQEQLIKTAGATQRFQSFEELQKAVFNILVSNKALIDTLGPRSVTAMTDPNSNLFSVWELRRLDRIIPNNRKILNLLDSNQGLIKPSDISIITTFQCH